TFEFEVAASALFEGDSGAEITTVEFLVKGVPFEPIESDETPGLYRVTVDFTDEGNFPMLADGATVVTMRATNNRGESSVTSQLNYTFGLDGSPPTVVINSPASGSIIGGTTIMTLTVEDSGSDVDWN